MSKRLMVLLALAFFVSVTAAYAEVQNVKVSGDITVKGVYRNNLDLAKEPVSGSSMNTNLGRDKANDFLSITRVRVDADLTDNVMTSVRLLNERNWNGESRNAVISNRNVGGFAAYESESQVDIDLAYVQLKEFLYSPLTMTVGRQELHFGNDFIVGDPDTNGISARSGLVEGDLSARKSFDAIRATFDYNPLVVDAIYAKVAENSAVLNDDTTLVGLNLAYELTRSTLLEGYFFSKNKGSNAAAVNNVDRADALGFIDGTTNKNKSDVVNVLGGRITNKSIKNLSVDGQAAYQFGTYNPKFDTNARWTNPVPLIAKAGTSERRAWGLEVMANYDLKDVKKIGRFSPTISALYVYLSGEDRDKVGDKGYRGWDPMFENQTAGHLINAIFGFSNIQLFSLSAQAKPKDDITVKMDYVNAHFAKRYPEGRLAVLSGVPGGQQFLMTKNSFMGNEFDGTVTYDYTEDVQFSVLGGIFLPAKSINDRDGSNNVNRIAATEVIGSMKVTF
jgi:hypothetical protein